MKPCGASKPSEGAAGGRPTSATAGFTLVEVLMLLVVSAIIGGALISLLAGQSLFYAKSNEAISAERNIRVAADMVASEVRTAAPEDLVAATADSVSLRYDILRAIVCDSTGPDEVAAFVLDTLSDFGLSATTEGLAYSGPNEDTFRYADGFTGTITTIGSGPKAVCTANQAPGALADSRYRTVAGWQTEFGELPDRGSYVRVYRLLTYRFAPSVFASGRTLWRGGDELVGPFADSASFSYVMSDGSVESAVAAGSLAGVRALRVSGTTEDTDSRFDVARSFNFDVEFRN